MLVLVLEHVGVVWDESEKRGRDGRTELKQKQKLNEMYLGWRRTAKEINDKSVLIIFFSQ